MAKGTKLQPSMESGALVPATDLWETAERVSPDL